MKYLRVIFIVLLIAGFSTVSAQNKDDAAGVKSTMVKLIDFSTSKNYKDAASLIAYDGDDAGRKWKDTFKYPAEKGKIKRVCRYIEKFTVISDKHDFGKFSMKKDGGVTWYIQEVNFISGGRKLSVEFSFVKSGSGFLLGKYN